MDRVVSVRNITDITTSSVLALQADNTGGKERRHQTIVFPTRTKSKNKSRRKQNGSKVPTASKTQGRQRWNGQEHGGLASFIMRRTHKGRKHRWEWAWMDCPNLSMYGVFSLACDYTRFVHQKEAGGIIKGQLPTWRRRRHGKQTD